MGMPLLLEEKIACGPAWSSTVAQRDCLASGCSMMASMIQSQPASRDRLSAVLPRVSSAAVRAGSITAGGRERNTRVSPAWTTASRLAMSRPWDAGTSSRTVGTPALVRWAAMAAPIVPAPMTAGSSDGGGRGIKAGGGVHRRYCAGLERGRQAGEHPIRADDGRGACSR